MKLLKTHPHTFERQGYEVDQERQETREKKKPYPKGVGNNNTSTKAIAIPSARGAWGENVLAETGEVGTKEVTQSCATV